jgi:TolA-binding protein
MEHLADKIQDYIEGQLEGEELLEFEQHMNQDTGFRNLVNLQSEVHEIINRRLSSNEEDLRETLFHAKTEMRGINQQSTFGRLKPFITIASAACVLLFGYLFFFNTNNSLYELPAMQSEIVRGRESNNQYEEAVKLYNEKSYTQSREILNALITLEPEVVQYQYYAALTYLGEENWTESKEKLTPIAEGQSIFKDEANYYLAVSLEKLDNKAEAIAILKNIPTQGKVAEKAKKLLKKLD